MNRQLAFSVMEIQAGCPSLSGAMGYLVVLRRYLRAVPLGNINKDLTIIAEVIL